MVGSRRVLLGVALSGALLTTGSVGAAEQGKRVEVFGIGSAYLGVSLDEVTKDEVARLKLAEERGALVRSVEDGSPAQKAGLLADDVIVRFQGEQVHTGRQLTRLVREQPAGRAVSIEVVRGGATQRLQATLDDRKGALREWRFDMPDLAWLGLDRDIVLDLPEPPEPPEAPRAPRAPFGPLAGKFAWGFGGPRKLGIEYQEIEGQLAKYFRLADDKGVLVSHVAEDGPAAKAGLKAGDVLLKIGGRAVRDGADLRDELRKAEAGSEIGVTVQRDGKPLDFKLKLDRRSGTPTSFSRPMTREFRFFAGAEPRRKRGLTT